MLLVTRKFQSGVVDFFSLRKSIHTALVRGTLDDPAIQKTGRQDVYKPYLIICSFQSPVEFDFTHYQKITFPD